MRNVPDMKKDIKTAPHKTPNHGVQVFCPMANMAQIAQNQGNYGVQVLCLILYMAPPHG